MCGCEWVCQFVLSVFTQLQQLRRTWMHTATDHLDWTWSALPCAPQNDLDSSQRSKWPGKLLKFHKVHNCYIIAFKGQQEHIYMDWDSSIIPCWWVKPWFLGIHADLHPELQLLIEAFPFPTMLSFHLSLFSLHPSIVLGDYGVMGMLVSLGERQEDPLDWSPVHTWHCKYVKFPHQPHQPHLISCIQSYEVPNKECLCHSNQVFFSVSSTFFPLVLCRHPAPSFYWS